MVRLVRLLASGRMICPTGLRAVLFATAVLWLWALPVASQDIPPAVTPILVLDQERLFQRSRAASRISAEIEQATQDLAAENRQIEALLSAEELELTEARPDMEPDVFRKLADEFDRRVQRLRTEQDAKELALTQRRESERQTFLRRITPILAEIARERGALAILDRRTVILSADAIEITDEVIARIDARLAEEEGTAPNQESPRDPPPETEPLGPAPDETQPNGVPDFDTTPGGEPDGLPTLP